MSRRRNAYEEIAALLLRVPGDLTQEAIGERLGFARGTVRDTIPKLVADGRARVVDGAASRGGRAPRTYAAVRPDAAC